MERMSSVFVSLIMVIAFSMGCSVKEDRSVCPCVMMLDFSGVDPDRTDSLIMSVLSADGFIHKDTWRSSCQYLFCGKRSGGFFMDDGRGRGFIGDSFGE